MHYLLPLKGAASPELAGYLRQVAEHCPVMVVDGSDPATFARNGRLFAGLDHVPPRADLRCANGKVAGVLTGFARCPSDTVLIADDDVRYRPAELRRVAQLLDGADLVVPQNYYAPLPWHARYDTARTLVNRALPSGDFPGTLAVRLTPRLRTRGYAGDVLFENLELIRTVRAGGGRVLLARDLYVRRLPPPLRQFAGQRVRQAYDSQAQPIRLAVELALLPSVIALRHRPLVLASLAAATVLLAECGRRRAGGAAYFPASAALLAPAWTAERALCAWVAVYRRMMRGGTPYAGRRITRAATSPRELARRAGGCRRRTA